jgi:glycogen(starch) synthase
MPDPQFKRILMTGDTVGGVWIFTLELAGGLAAQGIEVVLATMGGEPSAGQRAEAESIAGLTLLASDCKLEWMEDPWADVAASGRWLLDVGKHFQPDLIHLNSYGHGALPWESPVVLTAHSCVLSWWEAVKKGPLPESWNRYRTEVTRSIRCADVLTAPSQTMLNAIARHYGPDLPGNAVVVPNGRGDGCFRAAQKEPLVLTAGRLWDEGKNAAAVAAIAKRLPWPVYLAGESATYEGCRMLGRLSMPELARWYGTASIYALPARYEPFGLSVLEAALSGCALVLGDIPSLREIWQDAAMYVPPDDSSRLEEALLRLISNQAYRESMARRAGLRAREFTPERMISGFMTVYQTAVRGRSLCAS